MLGATKSGLYLRSAGPREENEAIENFSFSYTYLYLVFAVNELKEIR